MTVGRAPARILRFGRTLFEHDPRKVTGDVLVTLLTGFFQGAGVLALVPLLAYLQVPDGAGAGSVTRIAEFLFGGLGLPRSLSAILVVYVIVVAARAALERYGAILDVELQTGFVRSLRTDLQRALLQAEWRFVVSSRRSDFLQVLANDTQRAGQAAAFLLRLFTATVTFVAYLAIALVLSPPVTLVALGGIGTLVFLLRGRIAVARSTGQSATGKANKLYTALTQQLDGLVEIRSYRAESRSVAALADTLLDFDALSLRFIRSHTASRFWMTTGGAVMLGGLLFVAVSGFRLPVASLMLLVYAFARLLPQATQLQSMGMQLSSALPGYEAVVDLRRRAEAAAEPPGEAAAPIPRQEIRLEGVSFSHRAGEPTVAGLDFTIPARRTTALIGPSGAGKSTTALLLLGLLAPESGRILVDGTEIDADVRGSWRRRIGYVPQDAFLLHDTLRANLLWARPDADEGALREALRLAAADGFVHGLPEGLDTVVGDRGQRLSGGERQRIALARALLVNPDVLLLDEATSSLDFENERRIFDTLESLHGRMTIVIITHRLASLGHVDEIVVLEGGRVTERGAREELAGRGDSRFSALLRQGAMGNEA